MGHSTFVCCLAVQSSAFAPTNASHIFSSLHFFVAKQLLLAAIAIRNKIKVITISGGSLGSQVEEERS